MQKFLFTLIPLIISTNLFANAPDTLWTRTYGGTGEEYGFGIQQTYDGGYIIAGRTTSYGAGYYDAWLIKTDGNGNKKWSKTFGGVDNDGGWTARQTKDSGYILVGTTYSYGAGDADIWLIKTDTAGVLKWSKTFGDTSFEYGYSVQQTTDGGYILVGITDNCGKPDIWLIKTDANGIAEWDTTFGDFNYDEEAFTVKQTADGGYIIAGVVYLGGIGDALLLKMDANGHQEWFKLLGGNDDEFGYSAEQTTDGGYMLVGTTASIGAGSTDGWLVKTDASGNIEWNKTFGGTNWDGFDGGQQTADGGYILAGRTASFGAGDYDAWLVKTDEKGNMTWKKTFGGANFDCGWTAQQTSDSLYVMVGWTQSFGAGGKDIRLIKMGRHKWTIMAFINGDNDLEEFAIGDVNEMERGIDSTSDYNIVVELDRCPGRDNSNGDWFNTRKYCITPDTLSDDTIRSELVEDLTEQNMGNPTTLIDFAKWGIKNYPADNYMLVIWNHGNGWYKKKGEQDIFKGISFDSTDNDNLGVANSEYRSAIDTISSSLGRSIDILANDACLMGMHEVAYEVKDFVDYFIGSEYTIPGTGFPYNTICDSLNKNKNLTPVQLSQVIVDKYKTSYENIRATTLSAIAMDDRFTHLSYCIDEFAKRLLELGGRTNPIMDSIRLNTLEFMGTPPNPVVSDSTNIDLFDFASQVSNSSLSAPTRDWADSVMAAINSAVIRKGHTHKITDSSINFDSAHGLAIYYPAPQNAINLDYILLKFPQQYDNWFAFINGNFINLEDSTKTPLVFSLFPPIPNPFTKNTVIKYTIPETKKVSLNLYDLTGRMVKPLVNQEQNPGLYTVALNSHTLSSGIYFVKLRAGTYTSTQKLMLTR
ncbi:MAG: clostripain-related cysteine peptidase [bacterium]|nr:clostripain-related cysteine peptidase [bacterium]